jgi:hypothetical protein
MKKALNIGVAVFVGFLIIMSCDKVKNPKQTTADSTTTGGATTGGTVTAVYRNKVLIEDYTGHKCGNCPNAALTAAALHNKYEDSVVVIAVHAGFFSKTDATYAASYTCSAGNAWDGSAGFNISAAGNPNGMINRKVYGGFTLVQKETSWNSCVSVAMKDTLFAKLELTPTYNSSTRNLDVSTKIKFVKDYSHDVFLNLVLTEDSIIGPQLDYSKSPTLVPSYVFNHMLRTSVNGDWGALAKSAPIAKNDSLVVTNNSFAVNASYNDNQLHLVGILYDATSRCVIYVEQVKLK